MAKPRCHRVAIPVSDIDACEKFYSALLENPGKRILPDRHYFDLGDFILAFLQPPEAGTWSFDENQYIYLTTPDLDAMRAKVEANGGKCLTENATMPWGETMFFATDPSGTRMGIVQEDTTFSM